MGQAYGLWLPGCRQVCEQQGRRDVPRPVIRPTATLPHHPAGVAFPYLTNYCANMPQVTLPTQHAGGTWTFRAR